MCEEIKEKEVSTEKATESTKKPLKGCVNANLLNVREEPSKDSKVVDVIAKGNIVKIVKSKSTEDFYKINIDKISGFCMKEFIDIIE